MVHLGLDLLQPLVLKELWVEEQDLVDLVGVEISHIFHIVPLRLFVSAVLPVHPEEVPE